MTPLIDEIRAALGDHPHLECLWRPSGFAVRSTHPDAKGDGRCHVWFLQPPRGVPVAFCYKISRLAFSRDRFSYGHARLRGENLLAISPTLDEILEWMVEGFRPSARPNSILRVVNFELPDEPD